MFIRAWTDLLGCTAMFRFGLILLFFTAWFDDPCYGGKQTAILSARSNSDSSSEAGRGGGGGGLVVFLDSSPSALQLPQIFTLLPLVTCMSWDWALCLCLCRFVSSCVPCRYRSPAFHVQSWYDEVKDYTYPYPHECNPWCPERCSGPMCTHYTQVRWQTENRLVKGAPVCLQGLGSTLMQEN